MTVKRMWVNQPSTLQPWHHRHGQNVLLVGETTAYFLSGPQWSAEVPDGVLSPGWIRNNNEDLRSDTGRPQAAV